ncbi:hypothetical protein ACLB2K_000648 [Fragaria x ananassa]
MHTLFVFLLLFSLVPSSHSLHGAAPPDYKNKGDILEVKVNKLSSAKTQLPYDYYSLRHCKPPVIINSSLSLGQALRGDLIKNSVYNFKMKEAEYCKVVCRVKLDEASAKSFKEKIDDEYQINMILDDLPVAVVRKMIDVPDGRGQSNIYVPGFQVGLKAYYAGSNEGRQFIHNHLSFKVKYHEDPGTDYAHIVGFEVTPYSIAHEYKDWKGEKTKLLTCTPANNTVFRDGNALQEVDADREVVFTYDVFFESTEVKWGSRWDTYHYMGDDPVHWFSLINSLIFVIFLSGVVAMMVMRTLYKDITNYNQLDTKDESREFETGWKLVHGDVFRLPHNANILCVCVGNGIQLFGMTLITMIFALLGFLSPSSQGELNIPMALLWIFMGIFAGYSSARLYKIFKGTEWEKIALLTVFMFPAICFGIIFMLNALIWREKSCGAVPFGTMFSLGLMWFGISVPLVFVGSYFGFKRPAIEDPVKTNEIRRQIPKLAWYKWVLPVLGGGFLLFAVVSTEFFSILTSIWLDQFYSSFGFLFIVFIILLVTTCEIAILLCYFQLRSEDYNWWWRAYLTAGSSALHMFTYSIYYFLTRLWIEKFVSTVLYFGYMLIVSFAFFLLTGTIGFCACFWFVRKIYSSVKFD